jgi:hypothetical protein
MIAVRRRISVAVAVLLAVSCQPSAAIRPTAAEPRVYLVVMSSGGEPGLAKEFVPRAGVLYIGVPFPGGAPDAGTVPVSQDGGMKFVGRANVCDPGDCNPPNLFKGDPDRALQVDLGRVQLPGGREGISLTIAH